MFYGDYQVEADTVIISQFEHFSLQKIHEFQHPYLPTSSNNRRSSTAWLKILKTISFLGMWKKR